jgi:hypothetical protein
MGLTLNPMKTRVEVFTRRLSFPSVVGGHVSHSLVVNFQCCKG